ncbi:MAG: family 20 glycosylhydrolase [Vicinamibacteria bacterium]
MMAPRLLAAIILAGTASACATNPPARTAPPRDGGWRAIHLLDYTTDADLETLARDVPALAARGINVIVLEVDYSFAFVSHPELRQGAAQITADGARRFAELCRTHHIRLIPEFQSLGHQSWAGETFPLLTKYPELDLTPGGFPNNKGRYCREWDPLNPEVNRIVFALMDEIIDGFGADALHVGMDEVFLLGSELSPSTKGKDPADLFAKAVNDIHRHVVEERHVEMLMWGDRLYDGKPDKFGEWEASMNGTAPAVDRIPKDIIICPWHYEKRSAYPSIPMFLDKGFRVLPASYNKVAAVRALIRYAERQDNPRLLGHLFTTWSKQKDLVGYAPLVKGMKLLSSGSSTSEDGSSSTPRTSSPPRG